MNDYRTSRAVPTVAAGGFGANPWLIAILVAIASFMETLDTTIANVLLNYILRAAWGSARTKRPGW